MSNVLKSIAAFSCLTLLILATGRALAQIAPGVTQSAAHTAIISGTLTSSDGTPVTGADIRLTGPAILTTKSDDRGIFTFTAVPWGNYQLSVSSSLGIATRAIALNGDISIAIQYQVQAGLRTIAHVSTSSSGVSINVTPASIASVTPSEYAFQGNASWQQLLNQVPGVSVGGGLRSGTTCAVAIPYGPFQPIILSINGALPYETSVTLDGMPLYNSAPEVNIDTGGVPGAGTDVSFLPLATFDTADIVRGPGANAPSIVDSIGGAFVLHPPSSVTANSYEFSISNDAYGGIVSNAKVALKLGRLSAIFTYGVNDSPGPLGSNYSFMPFPAYWPVSVNGNPTAAPLGGVTESTPLFPVGNSQTAMYCCFSTNTVWTQHNGAASLSYVIAPNITAQVFYAGSSTQSLDPAPKYQVTFAPDSGYSGSIAPGTYDLFAIGQTNPFSKSESLLEEKVTAYVGTGVLRVAALQNNSGYTDSISPTFFPNGDYKVWGGINFASAPTTPVNYNGTTESLAFTPYVYDAEYWTNNRDLLGSYDVQLASRSNLNVSYITSYYNSPIASTLIYDGFRIPYEYSPALSETTDEFRIGFGTQLSDRLSLDGSWYFAQGSFHVPNPADTATWKNPTFPYNAPRLSAVWRATSNIAVRAAAGGGYALPPLSYLNGTNAVNLPCTTICSESVTNLNLRPETSFGLDLGADVRFNRSTVLSADLYQSNLFGQFYETLSPSGTFEGLPLYIEQYVNLAESRYEGMNLSLQHDVAKGWYWNAALGLNRAYVVNVPGSFYNGTIPDTSIPCAKCANTNVVPGINFNGSFESTVPYANGMATIGYRWAPERFVDLQPTYYGSGNPYFEPAFVELDGHVGYSFTPNITLFVTVRNISGVYDSNIQTLLPTGSVPAIQGANPNTMVFPQSFVGIPYGPRSVIVTANFRR